MNSVNYILKNKLNLSFEDKCVIKRLGADCPDIVITNQGKSSVNRKFNRDWYKKKPWLTASIELKSLFCFPCLLFAKNSTNCWTSKGYCDMKHLSEALNRHELSAEHFDNNITLKRFGQINIAEQVDSAFKRDIIKKLKKTGT